MRASQQQRRSLDPSLRSIESQEFENSLREKIVGQEEGILALVDLYQVFCAGMCPSGRPVRHRTRRRRRSNHRRASVPRRAIPSAPSAPWR